MAGNRCRKRAIPAGAPVMVEVTFMEPFEYIKPSSPAEASAILAAEGSAARILQGGTDLIIRMRGDFIHPKIVVDLKGLPGMRDVAFNPDDGLILGAAVTMNEVATHPAILAHYRMLADACETVGSYQLRNRATIGGSVCNASPAGDSIPALLCYDATAVIYNPAGERRLPLFDFFRGPGKTDLKPGEFLQALELPAPPAGAVGIYNKLGRTKVGDIAVIGVGVLGWPQRSNPSGSAWRIALASVGPTPLLAPTAEALLAQETDDLAVDAAAAAVMNACRPIDDVRASGAYRQAMVRVLARRAIEVVLAHLPF